MSVHVSYDASTRGLLGASFFTALKKGAYLVNTSRGGVVDEAAMLHALEAKVLAGAGLDVLSGEPLVNASHPVVEYAKTHANMVLVPHIGGNTIESFEKTEVFVAPQIARGARAMRVLGIVPARGGSKRVPRKNLRVIGGKTLTTRALDACLGARSLAAVALSSDDDEVLALASAGVSALRRPQAISGDSAPAIDYVLHALEQLERSTERFDAGSNRAAELSIHHQRRHRRDCDAAQRKPPG